jgi:hypothetical protein
MVENQKELQGFLIAVVFVVEPDDTYENLVFVEFVLERKLMFENCLELESQVGKNKMKDKRLKMKGKNEIFL